MVVLPAIVEGNETTAAAEARTGQLGAELLRRQQAEMALQELHLQGKRFRRDDDAVMRESVRTRRKDTVIHQHWSLPAQPEFGEQPQQAAVVQDRRQHAPDEGSQVRHSISVFRARSAISGGQ